MGLAGEGLMFFAIDRGVFSSKHTQAKPLPAEEYGMDVFVDSPHRELSVFFHTSVLLSIN